MDTQFYGKKVDELGLVAVIDMIRSRLYEEQRYVSQIADFSREYNRARDILSRVKSKQDLIYAIEAINNVLADLP